MPEPGCGHSRGGGRGRLLRRLGGLERPRAAHALLAVPSTAPHNCPAPNEGHACDSKLDIMNPYVTGGIDQLILDVNHDDYYGNGRAFDLRNSPWLERLDLPRVSLR